MGLPKCKYLETFHVEFHRAHVWIVVLVFHHALSYLAQTELCSDFAQMNLSYRGPFLLWDNGIFSPFQDHRSRCISKISCCFWSAPSGQSHNQIALEIQDHIKQYGVMNWQPQKFSRHFLLTLQRQVAALLSHPNLDMACLPYGFSSQIYLSLVFHQMQLVCLKSYCFIYFS